MSFRYNNVSLSGKTAEMILERFKKAVYDTGTLSDFTDCRGSWGYRGGRIYLEKMEKFTRAMRTIAKKCGVMYYNSKPFVFTGKIYEPVNAESIRFVYNMLLDWLGITIMMNDNKYYKACFLDVAKVYNLLEPRHDIIAFDNGVLNLETLDFHKHSPDFHCLYAHSYKYNPKAKCPMWNAFLREVLPDKSSRIILQMFLGLGLTERATVYDRLNNSDDGNAELCLLLIGAGSNGKSVIYNTAMGIFGKDRISGADYNELTSPGDEGLRARRLLRGCLFNWSSDSDARQFEKRTGIFKKIVSGEPVTDRAIGGDVEENYNMPYLIFNLNELPTSTDSSLGFVRRLQYISFENIIPKHKQNKHLSNDLIGEYPGIFNWIIRGAKEIRRRRFVFPDSEGSYRMLLKTMARTNPVHAWVSAYGVRPFAEANGEISVAIPASKLLESINAFSKLNGSFEVSSQFMGATLNQHGFFKRRTNTGILYQVFGCTEDKLDIPFCIDDEEFGHQYVGERGSYIEDND